MKKYEVRVNLETSTEPVTYIFDPRNYKWNSILDARVAAVRHLSFATEYYEQRGIDADVALRIID